MKISTALKTFLGTAALALPLVALADSTVQTGAGPPHGVGDGEFSMVIPQILYLRVGTGSAYTTGA